MRQLITVLGLSLFLISGVNASTLFNIDHLDDPPNNNCNTRDDEIFITLAAEVDAVKIRIINHDTQSVLHTSYEITPDTDTRCFKYHWIASTDDADTSETCWYVGETQYCYEAYNGMTTQTAYEIHFLEEVSSVWTSQLSFLYYDCNGAGDESFYCPRGAGASNDFIIYYGGSGGYDIDADAFHEDDHFPNEAAFSDENWMFPLDMGVVCAYYSDVTSTCANRHTGFFLSPQLGTTSWTHTAADLRILGGTTWGQSVTISTTDTLTFPTGYGIDVDPGATLTLKDGMRIRLPANADVDAEGILVVDGTSSYPVRFERSGASNWGEVYLHTDKADGSSFDYAIFDHGSTCLYLSGTDNVTITNSLFDTCGSGSLHTVSGTGIEFEDNSIVDSGGHGVDVDGGSLRMEGNTIQDYDATGVSVDEAFVELYGANDGPGDNVITNGDWGIYADDSAVDAGDHSNNYGGDNSITTTMDERVYVINNSEVLAEDNWWGSSSPPSSDFYADGSSTLVYAFALSSDPNASKGGGSGTPALASGDLTKITSGDSSPGASGRFVRAINDVRESRGREASANVLSEILRDDSHPQRGIAARYYVSDLGHTGELLLAVTRGEGFLVDSTIPRKSKAKVARELFSIYVDTVKSLTGASRMRALLAQYEHKDYESGFITKHEERFAASLGRSIAAGKRGDEIARYQPYHEMEVNAYPNPFRGSTRIEFRVEEPADVELVVYDILGREIRRLVRNRLDEGYYNFRFGAENLARGIYFYRLRAGEKMKTGKLIYSR